MKTVIWSIDQLERQAIDGTVVTAHWRVTVTDGDVSSAAIGPQKFTPNPNDPSFVPFESLTEEQVVGWVKTEMGDGHVAALEAKLASEVDEKLAPAVVPGTPWTPAPVAPPAEPEPEAPPVEQ